MCLNCPDFVEYCREGDCHTPDGGPYGKYAKFYLGDKLCKHLEERYSTASASLLNHVRYEHERECAGQPCRYLDYGFDHSPEEIARVEEAVMKERKEND